MDRELKQALRKFRTQYPKTTSADLQTFILGWIACEKTKNIEINYRGFVKEFWERAEKGLPICRDTLKEMAVKYNTPIPGSKEWIKENL